MHHQSKRRKLSPSVSTGMSITKLGLSTQHAEQDACTTSIRSPQSSQLPTRQSSIDSDGRKGFTTQMNLFAPQTLIRNLSVPSTNTLIDEVRTSHRPGTIVYSSPQYRTDPTIFQPTAPLLRPGTKQDHTSPFNLTPCAEELDVTSGKVHVHGDGSEPKTTSPRMSPECKQQSMPSLNSSREQAEASGAFSSEDYFGDDDNDDDFAQDLAQLERRVYGPQLLPTFQTLPTPLSPDKLGNSHDVDTSSQVAESPPGFDLESEFGFWTEAENAELFDAVQTAENGLIAQGRARDVRLCESDLIAQGCTTNMQKRERGAAIDIYQSRPAGGSSGKFSTNTPEECKSWFGDSIAGSGSFAEQSSFPCILREPFSAPILDRSPIHGASNVTLLRTCFRVGEALQAGTQAFRAKQDVILELYACVVSSWHADQKQHFVFRDLYHHNPPHIQGLLDCRGRDNQPDSCYQAFSIDKTANHKFRVIAKMMRNGSCWTLNILRISETDWDHINHVAGVYAKDSRFRASHSPLSTGKSR